ncbi:ISNCY family transposase [Senegalia sp. (in: firmicutes)]|uniref:ISNCY family transposase n=1 Tax=Senegalia sp. (in: firmicutes) TaxID=1924098 RepID=UPI003F984FD5
MTQNEISRLRVINQTIDKVITNQEAAELLNLSERQVIRVKKGVVEEGPAFIIHKNRGRKPKHATLDETRELIIELKQTKYEEANFNHFQELIEEHENIQISYPTVYRILTEAGIKSPKKHRKRKTHHRRKRKPQKGMLVQIDASPHKWIIGSNSFDLHGAIDDATGEIFALHFTPNECMEGYFEIVRQIISNHGIPTSLYCDRHTIFISPKDDKLSLEDQLEGKTVNLTQFGRAMDELGINIIKAYSPQAKGRIERLWGTLQSRLPVEFKIHGITTIEQANTFLAEFIVKYNKKFGVVPEDDTPAFRSLDSNIDLNHILCIKEERTIIEGSAFSYGGRYYQLIKNNKKASALPKAKLTVLTSSKIGVRAMYSNVVYDTKQLEERPKKANFHQAKMKTNKSKPSKNHPWRNNSDKKTTPSFKESLLYEKEDIELDNILKDLFNSTRAWV